MFRLPKDEKLDGHTDCTLWTPFNKRHILGQMFVSTNYICFTGKEETVCSLIIPLREVGCLLCFSPVVDNPFTLHLRHNCRKNCWNVRVVE